MPTDTVAWALFLLIVGPLVLLAGGVLLYYALMVAVWIAVIVYQTYHLLRFGRFDQ